MPNLKRRKSPKMRLAGYMAHFTKTSRGGSYYKPGIRPRYFEFFTFDSRHKAIPRPGFTQAGILAAIGGEATYKRAPVARLTAANQNIDKQLAQDANQAQGEGEFDSKNAREGRKKINRAITLRRGQPEFRKKLLEAYRRRCAVTNCDCPDALEAAHIIPYSGNNTNHIQNGILLRSDIHTLFDIGKIGFAPASDLPKSLRGTVYSRLKEKRLRLPLEPKNRPNDEALRQHLHRFGLKST